MDPVSCWYFPDGKILYPILGFSLQKNAHHGRHLEISRVELLEASISLIGSPCPPSVVSLYRRRPVIFGAL